MFLDSGCVGIRHPAQRVEFEAIVANVAGWHPEAIFSIRGSDASRQWPVRLRLLFLALSCGIEGPRGPARIDQRPALEVLLSAPQGSRRPGRLTLASGNRSHTESPPAPRMRERLASNNQAEGSYLTKRIRCAHHDLVKSTWSGPPSIDNSVAAS